MKRLNIALLIMFMLTACSSPKNITQTTIPETQTTVPISTAISLPATKTHTPLPVYTSTATITSTSAPLPTEIIDAKGVTMVLVPAGMFIMGDSLGSPYPFSYDYELDGFYMDMFEVTNALYKECADANVCTEPHGGTSHYQDLAYSNHPVVLVDWYQAKEYCEWRGARLPTWAEWEKAARGTDGRAYPWGDDAINCGYANYSGRDANGELISCVGDTSEVGIHSLGVSPYGVHDMAGNVWEWVSTKAGFPLPYDENDGRENLASPEDRSVRGGGWQRGNYRSGNYGRSGAPDEYSNDRGFRCARDAATP